MQNQKTIPIAGSGPMNCQLETTSGTGRSHFSLCVCSVLGFRVWIFLECIKTGIRPPCSLAEMACIRGAWPKDSVSPDQSGNSARKRDNRHWSAAPKAGPAGGCPPKGLSGWTNRGRRNNKQPNGTLPAKAITAGCLALWRNINAISRLLYCSYRSAFWGASFSHWYSIFRGGGFPILEKSF